MGIGIPFFKPQEVLQMFKNAKLLKGSTIALVCALVLCLGIVFGIYYAGAAAANTVTLYVSEHGDNTTGADESSAFTSIEAATTAANGMNLKPGMEVKILVVERVCLNNRYINTKVLDTAGNEVPVTVEGYGYDGDEGNLPEIYCEWYDASNMAEYRLWVLLQGDINFRNVKFLSKLHDGYVKGKSSGLKNRLCTRYFYANGHYATFDNVVFTTEAPDTIKWTLRADSYASAAVSFKGAGRSGFTLKNGDYSNCSAIGASTYPTSKLDLDISFENATIPYVTILGNTTVNESSNASLHQKANSIKVTFGDGTIVKKNSSNCSVRLNASGYNVIPGGVTINYMEGAKFEGKVHADSVSSKVLIGDWTNNIYGGTFADVFYAGPTGTMIGKLTNNIKGGTFSGNFYAGGDGAVSEIVSNIENTAFNASFYGGVAVSGETGNIVNNLTGCNVGGNYYGGNVKGTAGNITNNLTETNVCTVAKQKGRAYMGSAAGVCGDVTNNLKSVVFNDTGEAFCYYGGIKAGTAGHIVNNIVDCKMEAACLMGGGYAISSGSAGHSKSVTNNLTGCTISGLHCGTRYGTISGDIKNNFYDGNTFSGTAYLSSNQGKVEGTVYNNFLGNTVFKNTLNCGFRVSSSTAAYIPAVHEGGIVNNFKAGTFNGLVYLSSNSANAEDGVVISTISGGTFATTVNGKGPGKVDSASLDIKPDESVTPILFNGAVSNSSENVTTTIYGGNQAIHLGSSANIYADALAGTKNVVFSQDVQWQDGTTYVSLPGGTDMSRVYAVVNDSSVAGTAAVQTDGGRLVVVGASGTGTVIGTVAPKLNGYSFALDNKLKVCFFIPVEQIEAYINFAGAWNYSVAMEGIEVLTGRITDVAEIPAASIANGAGDVPCFVLTTDFGIAATDFDQTITVTWSGNEEAFAKSAYELLEGGIGSASTKAEIATLLKAIYNYGIEAENVFEGKNVALKYDVTYTGTYNGAPSRTSAEDGFEFFATSLSLDGEVALNFYLKLADGVAANQMTFTAKSAAGAVLDASKITVKAVDGVKEYDVIVSVKLSVPEMANAYTLSAALADGTVVATCTNSIANSCAGYIASQNKFAPVSKALLAYIEKAAAAL